MSSFIEPLEPGDAGIFDILSSSIIAIWPKPAATAGQSPTGARARTARVAALTKTFVRRCMVILQFDWDGLLIVEVGDGQAL
ncbi:hypothetical protein [Bradyrhizobium sp. RDT46]|uniref:hypothetical protein n=1 Tax=Bradyrhizobium sp. RDT46 TaxID=3341829 RepID=UPI0035C74B8E